MKQKVVLGIIFSLFLIILLSMQPSATTSVEETSAEITTSTDKGSTPSVETQIETGVEQSTTTSVDTESDSSIEGETETGVEKVKIEKVEEGISSIMAEGVSATTTEKIILEKSKIYIETSAGNKKIILPKEASYKAKVTTIKEIKLEEESATLIYSVIGQKKIRLFFIIPFSMEIETKVDAETGEVVSINKSWWGFLAKDEEPSECFEEECNGIDDDCDSSIDEDSNLCGEGKNCEDGICKEVEEEKYKNCKVSGCSNKIIMFKESEEGEFLFSPHPENNPSYEWWQIKYSEVIKKFYEVYNDEYDFLVLFPTVNLRSHTSFVVNRNIYGIGNDPTDSESVYSSFTKKLKSLLSMNFYHSYKFYKDQDNEPEFSSILLKRVLIHEIGHHWGIDVKGLKKDRKENMGGHWIYNIDLFNGNPNYVDPMGYYHWVIGIDTKQCIDGNLVDSKFSNLTLYLMGLIHPSDVGLIKVHDFEEILGDYYYNLYGPDCSDDPIFTDTREVSIQDIISINGKRVPVYDESQKQFCTAFVVIVPYDQDLDEGFVNYLEKYREALPSAWAEITDYKSEIIDKDCTDSDCGLNYFVKGNTIGFEPQAAPGYQEKDVWDVCVKDSEGIFADYPNFQNNLYEYGCREGIFYSEMHTCPNGCKEGACITN